MQAGVRPQGCKATAKARDRGKSPGSDGVIEKQRSVERLLRMDNGDELAMGLVLYFMLLPFPQSVNAQVNCSSSRMQRRTGLYLCSRFF